MNINRIKVLVIAGPTASGKSDLAIRLARKFNGEIVSADSRQVYRGMDIGSGKVTKREQKLARHWLLDVASATRQYTVAHFKRDAQKAIRDIIRRGKLPIICGGTGFWIDALVYDAQLPNVKPNARFRRLMEAQPTSVLQALLRSRDPIRAQTIDLNNRRRIIRALEIIEATGQRIPKLMYKSPYDLLYLAVSMDTVTLAGRITKRLDARIRGGMVGEVRRLRASGVSWRKLESFGLEYRWVGRYLHGECTKRQMREKLLTDIIRYAKRQMTWWRTNDDIRWITGPTQAERLVKAFVK